MEVTININVLWIGIASVCVFLLSMVTLYYGLTYDHRHFKKNYATTGRYSRNKLGRHANYYAVSPKAGRTLLKLFDEESNQNQQNTNPTEKGI